MYMSQSAVKKGICLLLVAAMLIPMNFFSRVSAVGVASSAGDPASVVQTSDRRNYSVPSEEKHAYNPFSRLEDEAATQEYRALVEYVDNVVIYKQTERTSLFSKAAKVTADIKELKKIGVATESARELNRREVDSGLFSTTYEVTYKAQITGDVWDAVDNLAQIDGIVDAQPEYIYRTTAIGMPDVTTDPDFDSQWYLSELHMQDVWQDFIKDDYLPGEYTVVAVIDTGVDYTHPDLAPNMWVNTAELYGTPGVDDDGNGYVDDIYGASTVGATPFHSGDPMDDHGHGTHVSGIIAMAAGNREGGVGIAYGTKIMAIKAGQATGTFTDSDIAEAIRYAVANGADVINMSFGGYGHSFLVEEALQDAFGSCVLVASAGNDGYPTADAPPDFLKKADTYPASYSYVLGVMATDQYGDLASFSNWDYYNKMNGEYELAAPGVEIFSTLPGGQYARWSGTSMAAPMVSAAAALLRSKYFDKNMYSSRFIMGQLASATEDAVYYQDKLGQWHAYAALNVWDSLNKKPTPNLTVAASYLFDSEDIAAGNDNDGIVDAGETIDLGLVLRNQWGVARDVTVTVDAISDGGVPNPNVEFLVDTIHYDEIGTFSQQDNDFRYDGDYLEGTDNPIRFRIKADTINDAHIAFNIHITARNGFDTTDDTIYKFDFKAAVSFFVQRGRVLKGRVTQDITLTKDDYWIIENSLLIPRGVTVTVEPGTQIQFWGSEPEGPYENETAAYIEVEGEFLVNGTEEDPVEMFPSGAFQYYAVDIRGSSGCTLHYANIINPRLSIEEGSHLNLIQDTYCVFYKHLSGSNLREDSTNSFYATRLYDSTVYGLRNIPWQTSVKEYYFVAVDCQRVLFDKCALNIDSYSGHHIYQDCVFLDNYIEAPIESGATEFKSPSSGIGEINYQFSDIYHFNGKKYVLLKGSVPFSGVSADEPTWKMANYMAQSRGGTLVCFNSSEEWEAVTEALFADYENGNSVQDYFIIGLTKDQQTGALQWVDGTDDYFPSISDESNPNGKYYALRRYGFDGGSLAIAYIPYINTYYDAGIIFEYPEDVSDEIITAPYTVHDYLQGIPEWFENGLFHSAVLNPLLYPDTSMWMHVTVDLGSSYYFASNNYWGTEDERLIQSQITDFDDYASLSDIIHTPWLTLESPELENIYPFVTRAYVTDWEGNKRDTVGFETVQIHVEFNRDMDENIQPMVSYGPAEPYTDHVVTGSFVTPRHWVGTATIKPIIDGGQQFIRVKGGAAADDNWLVTGTDWGRFAFNISNTGAQALTLQAEGLENKVRLTWTQTDYDTLAGYNVYRSESEDGPFEKINTRLVPGTIREYTDTDVEPGKDYYYYFTVVGTDMTESSPSNTAKATPLDNIPPTLEHVRVTRSNYGEAISLSAVATDNIGVTYVKAFYRAVGTEGWTTLNLTAGENNRYFGVIPAAEVSRAGMEYYIEASDGNSVARDGSALSPIRIAVDSTASIYSVSPSHVDTTKVSAGITGVIVGVNFTPDMVLKVGSKQVEYTFESEKQLTFTIPEGAIGRVDVTLTRGEETARLTNAITYEDPSSEVQIVGGEIKAREEVRLPVFATAAGDLLGVDLKIKLNASLFSSVAFEKAEECANASAAFSVSGDEVIISLASPTALPKGSPIGYLVLTANDLAETTASTIQITSATLNDVDAASRISAQITVVPNFTVSGRVTYYQGGAPMAGVTVRLSNGMSAVTDEDGRYTITGVTTGNVRVIPEYHGNVNNAISAQDASMVLQAIVGSASLTEEQRLAADVNGDGELSAMDAAYILQKTVGILTDDYPGSGAEWIFTPAEHTLTLTGSNTELDFSAILLGDVTGDWQAEDSGELS